MSAGTAVRPPDVAPAPTRRGWAWVDDLVLGVRLAVGGGRTSWTRLVLGTIGIGLATAVLLVAASVNHILTAEGARGAASEPNFDVVHGVAPLHMASGYTEFRGTMIPGYYLAATGANSPVPPGIPRLPGPNEVLLSPALQQLLDSPDGALLRPRFPQHVIGQISQAGLRGPHDLTFYAGIPNGEQDGVTGLLPVYSFGLSPTAVDNPSITVLVATGVVALLIPILIMISVSSRIAGAARDRRLSALRLVGAGARQVRRIAAAETLVPTATGLVLGGILYLIFRQIMPHVQMFGVSVYTSDVVAPLPLVVLTLVLVPLLAVGSSLFALRRIVIEPLGVVRGGRPVRRRLWWRIGLVVAGVGALLIASVMRSDDSLWVGVVVGGASALLAGVPVMLPYLLERGVSAMRGGPVSWQLAIRRLQLDSGTPARVVAGVAVVLAGAIALSTVLAATAAKLAVPENQPESVPGSYFVVADTPIAGAIADSVRRTGVVTESASMLDVQVTTYPRKTDGSNDGAIAVASCPVLRQLLGAADCHDGDVFSREGRSGLARPGTRLTTVVQPNSGDGAPTPYGSWTVPQQVRALPTSSNTVGPGADLWVTPGALTGVRLPPQTDTWLMVHVDQSKPDGIEYVRDALAGHPLTTYVETLVPPLMQDYVQRSFVEVRDGLLIGSLFTLGLAGISLLVLALEQVRERRRPLAMLSASGVARTVLARSLLWQTAVPVGFGVVAAVVTGIGLAFLVLRITGTSIVLDWADVGIFSALAVVLVLLVTAATLPALRSATRLSSLRTE